VTARNGYGGSEVPRRTVICAAVLMALLVAYLPNAALADKRVALVIGIGAYEHAEKLANPTRDASAIAEMFKKAGFETVLAHNDLGNLQFKRSLRDFLEVAQGADIAVLFYAGHGIQIGDQNYMVPVDAKLEQEYDAKDESISLERIVEALEPAKRLKLVILDACRANPFLVNMQRRVASRGPPMRGLARVEPTQVDTLIAYAAKAGSTASDGWGGNSPYTAALLKHLTEPGLDIRLAFGRVRDDVIKSTDSKQEPFVYGSLGGSNISLVPAPAVPQEAPTADVAGDYRLVERVNSRMAWEVFINTHRTGILVDLARKRLQELEDQERVASSPRPKIAALPPEQQQSKPTPEDVKAWNRVKDSGDRAAIRQFIESHRSSPLAIKAQEVLDELGRIAREKEEKAVAEREAAREREEEARRAKAEADRQKAEREAALAKAAREESERKKKAEADRKQAEHEAALAKAAREKAEAIRKKAEREHALAMAAEAEAERKRQADADRQKWEQEALAAKAAREKAEADRQKAEREAAIEAEVERKRQAELDRLKSEHEAALAKAAHEQAEHKRQAEACSREEKHLDRLKTAINESTGREELTRFERLLTCEALRPSAAALVVEANKLKEAQALAAAQVRAAQQELRRIGCYSGRDDGAMQEPTKNAIRRYLTKVGRPVADINVTEDFVNELRTAPVHSCLEIAKNDKSKQTKKQAEKAKQPEKVKQTQSPRRESQEPRQYTTARPAASSSPRLNGGVGF
jgi:hypothetical protein